MSETTNHIPTQWTTEGFMQRFEELLPQCATYLAAYNKAEDEHRKLFGFTRYKGYDAFRMTRKQLLLKK